MRANPPLPGEKTTVRKKSKFWTRTWTKCFMQHTYWRTTFGITWQKSWTILECRQGLLSLREKCTIFITIFINNFFILSHFLTLTKKSTSRISLSGISGTWKPFTKKNNTTKVVGNFSSASENVINNHLLPRERVDFMVTVEKTGFYSTEHDWLVKNKFIKREKNIATKMPLQFAVSFYINFRPFSM